MSVEHRVVTAARPYMLSTKARGILAGEGSKGCRPEIAPEPVALEPLYHPISDAGGLRSEAPHAHWAAETPCPAEELVRLQVWISPDQKAEWDRSEALLKQLQVISHRLAFEIMGNTKGITFSVCCHQADLPVVRTGFLGTFDLCRLEPYEIHPLLALPAQAWSNVVFRDYFPPPPYSHLLTRFGEIRHSPFEPLIQALAAIPETSVGLYQVLFQPVDAGHNWHQNIQALLDLEFTSKLWHSSQTPMRYAQQTPSGDQRQMAMEVESKAHDDKPIFAAALRVAIVAPGPDRDAEMSSLATFAGLFQHGGRPLNYLTDRDYAGALDPARVRNLFIQGLTYRAGFLANSLELTGLVHLPLPANLEVHRNRMEMLETLVFKSDIPQAGTLVGTNKDGGRVVPVRIPQDVRALHNRLIGRTGKGKSTLFEPMILQDIDELLAVIVLDPHGDLIERLLCLIPAEHADRVIYFNPGDPDWVPLWNPLTVLPGQAKDRVADELVSAIKRVVTGWGDRLETLLKNAIYALLHRPGSTLLDVANLLRKGSAASKALQREILQVVGNEHARRFWLDDFRGYRKDELSPPQHKLSKLLLSDTVSLMLSQPESAFSFRQVMDQGQVLLVDLSTVGPSVADILGQLVVSLLQMAAVSRSDTPADQRKDVRIYCDEAQRFLTDAVEVLLSETRKFGVALTFAHQCLSQFDPRKADALSGVGATIIFSVDSQDAQYLKKDLLGRVEVNDLMTLERGQAIARIGDEVIKIETPEPETIREPNARARIIEESHRRYYRPAAEVRGAIADRADGPLGPLSADGAAGPQDRGGDGHPEELPYDEF